MLLDLALNNLGYLILLVPVAILIYQSVVIVGGNEIALIERRWFGSKMPQGRVVALGNEVGIQARTLGPGLHFLIRLSIWLPRAFLPRYWKTRSA